MTKILSNRLLSKARCYSAFAAVPGIVFGCALLNWWLFRAHQIAEANIVMIFLAGVALSAAWFGHRAAIAASILSVLVFDFFFVHPNFSLAPGDEQYFVTFAVMLGIGLLISTLTSRLLVQLRGSQLREHRTGQLYRMTQSLGNMNGTDRLILAAGKFLSEMFVPEIRLFVFDNRGVPELGYGPPANSNNSSDLNLLTWVARNGRAAGAGTEIEPNASSLCIPMVGLQQIVGLLEIVVGHPQHCLDAEQLSTLEICASMIALAIERDRSNTKVRETQIQVQSEQLRNSLLSSVSHDLRTPLATIAVTAASALDNSVEENVVVKRELLETIVDESRRLSRQVDNLLHMARFDAGSFTLNREWHVLEELVGVAIRRLRPELKEHSVEVRIPFDFPLLWLSDELMEQVLMNVLDNAIRYTPERSRIEITARIAGEHAEILVADNGPGLAPGTEAKIFEKFFRGGSKVADGQRGVGLGLAICLAIVRAHGGSMTAQNRKEGGTQFTISLPLKPAGCKALQAAPIDLVATQITW